MRILVVEDEPKTASYLRKGLNEKGFEVDLADNGAQGLFLATHKAYELVILDVMLPLEDGWSVLTKMRKAGRATPVLFLTACDSVPDRVRGLELGADDYLVKPFSFSELLARVGSLARRGRSDPAGLLRVADLELDLARHRVARAGRSIELTPKEFGLLLLLAQHVEQVLSRAFISEQVWNMDFETDNNVVDVAIRRLRSKMDDPFENKLIHSVRGVGYVLRTR
jgi:two-component system copper resistance phosphate regulon response regulator CusR